MPEAYLNLVSPQSWNTIRKSYHISWDPGMVYLSILTIKNQLNLGKPFKSTSNFCLVVHLILPPFHVFQFCSIHLSFVPAASWPLRSRIRLDHHTTGLTSVSHVDSLHLFGLLGVWVEFSEGM